MLMKRDGRRLGHGKPGLSLLRPRATFGKGTTMHYEQQQVGNTVVTLSTRPEAFNAEPIREPFERALKIKGKSTSAKGRIVGEDVKLAKVSGKEENEHTQEWWEGYDPGMDASF
jgi:hypothetical protein